MTMTFPAVHLSYCPRSQNGQEHTNHLPDGEAIHSFGEARDMASTTPWAANMKDAATRGQLMHRQAEACDQGNDDDLGHMELSSLAMDSLPLDEAKLEEV
ncbi:hypothetical protein P7K49_004604 [Saguinus oedipus]|uniref:Uncharacterized protein n=1 Tax=Saguinus oedipus TaxID=9490 RepID=A0ABQ9W7X7_SAGOE|nr:hypothetical protein P7K49_004604 [Saguinus oedipus]